MELKSKKIHFIAIGGAGMSALAKYCFERGAIVSGSDISESKYTHLLENMGIKVYIGHDASLIEKDMIIAASTAVKPDNPEIKRAKELNLNIYHRSDILKMLSDEFSVNPDAFFIGFSGTHGKTTTSGLASYLLEKSGYKPSYVIGGVIPDINTNGKYAGGKFFIAELDESDGTIQKYKTDTAVINNMENDHLDYYKNGFSDIAQTFEKYLKNNPGQKVIINSDNEGCKKFMKLYPGFNYITFGLNSGVYTAENINRQGVKSSFDIYKNGSLCLEGLELSIPGIHNIYNALAVLAALNETGIDINALKRYLPDFTGMARRFQKSAEFDGIKVYDDYAHHPSEIKAVLKAAREASDGKRIIAVFQPHRYTRFKNFWEDFKQSFNDADEIFVLDVYSAGETPIKEASPEKFVKEFNSTRVKYIQGSIEEAAKKIRPYLKSDDIVITLGAGTITNMGKCLYNERMKNEQSL